MLHVFAKPDLEQTQVASVGYEVISQPIEYLAAMAVLMIPRYLPSHAEDLPEDCSRRTKLVMEVWSTACSRNSRSDFVVVDDVDRYLLFTVLGQVHHGESSHGLC